MLLSPSGVSVKEQYIGTPSWSGAGGEIVFSPDGTKMARANPRDDLRIFDFDRCTGTLSNPIFIPIINTADNNISGGAAFSANSRFLYVADGLFVYQYDFYASDFASSQTLVAEQDEVLCPFATDYTYMELGPDGRIYCRPSSGQNCMHYIEHPERAGTACEVHPHGLYVPTSYDNLTHFPNFRLGPIDGSACDTLGLDNYPLAGWRYQRTLPLTADFTSVSWFEPDTWYWEFEDCGTSAEQNPTHTFPAAGTYEVCLTVSNQYGSDTKCKQVWVTANSATNGIKPGIKARVFPNPASTKINIDLGEYAPDELTVGIFNLLGQSIKTVKFSGPEQQYSIPVEGFPAGLYRLSLHDQAGRLVGSAAVLIQR
ncbi:MAG: PKD domain-containing protein [Lewinellaceae bacterium]|nr:PKD domain-containing protein [Lewinellaceae bacterium]